METPEPTPDPPRAPLAGARRLVARGIGVGLLILLVARIPGSMQPSEIAAAPSPSPAPPPSEEVPPDAPRGDGVVAVHVSDRAREPLVGAEIRVTDPEGSLLRLGMTGPDGLGHVGQLPREPVVVEVRAPGFAATASEVTPGTTPTEVRLELDRTSVLAGQVLTPAGRPAEGATVTVAGSGIWPPRTLTTEDDGRFRIEALPAGVYEVSARQGSLRSPPRQGLSVAEGAPVHVALRLQPGAGLAGEVVDARDGSPIADAVVTITEDQLSLDPQTVRTGPDGEFQAGGLATGTHWITVSAEGYVARVAEEHPAGKKNLRFALRPAAVVSGVVLDARHRPVAGAQLEVVGRDGSTGQQVAMTGPAFGLRDHLADAAAPASDPDVLPVTAGPVPPIPVSALAPAPDETSEAPLTEVSPLPMGFSTDDAGRFEIRGVPPGMAQVVARHGEHAPGSTRPLRVVPGKHVDGLEIILPEGGRVEGRVLDTRGFPVPRIPVQLRMAGESGPRLAVAEEDGTFTFDGVAGTIVVAALPDGEPVARTREKVSPGERVEMAVELPDRSHTLRARTVDQRGFPVAGVRLVVRALRPDTPVERIALSGQDGTVEVGRLPGPPYRVVARHPDYAESTLGRIENDEREVSIEMRPGVQVAGRVLDGFDDVPLAGAQVQLQAADGGATLEQQRTSTSGDFEFNRVPSGEYRVLFDHSSFSSASRSLVIQRGRRGLMDPDPMTVELTPGGHVTGRVTDRHGQPVGDAEVTAGAPPDWSKAVRADAEGHFSLQGIPPGPTRIHARHPAAGQGVAPRRVVVRVKTTRDDVVVRLPRAYDAEHDMEGAGFRTGVAVQLQPRGVNLRVTRVLPDTAAQEAGLRPGDVLLAVDDEEVTSADQARDLLAGPPGVEAVLDLRRDGEDLRVMVPRERYVP